MSNDRIQCDYDGCNDDAKFQRRTKSGHVVKCCGEHDPLTDLLVANCFETVRVGP